MVVGCTRGHSLEMVMVHKTYKNHTDGHQYGAQYYEFSDDWGGSIIIGRDCRKRLHSVLDPSGPTLVALHGDL